MIAVERIFISPGHNFFGRHGKPAGDHPTLEVDKVECVAGAGLRGDRFFGYKDDYKGQVTLFSADVFGQMREELGVPNADAGAMRRNLIVSGIDLNELIGCEFEVQGVRFAGVEECRPCYWMDRVIGPGAEAWLKGRGGLRCRILSNGWLQRVRAEQWAGAGDRTR